MQVAQIFICDFVSKVINGTCLIGSEIKEDFVKEYRTALEETKGVSGVVYVFKSEKLVPRLKGSSHILYIGETQNDVWSRYNVQNDTENFWHVYSHILRSYGNISIDVYVSSNHKSTERTFIAQYFQEHLELPPINRKG